MRRLLEYLIAPLRRRRNLNRMLRIAAEAGSRNPDTDPVPMLVPGKTVFSVPVAYRVGDRHGVMNLHLHAHPKNPRSVLVAAALRCAAARLPGDARLRLVAEPVVVEP